MREAELFAAYGRPTLTPDDIDEHIPHPVASTPERDALFAEERQRARFWARVRRLPGIDSCWLWMGPRTRLGYGVFRLPVGSVLAHRFAYEATTGEKLGDLLCRHKCDRPPCVRPDHLESGTGADNMRDLRERGPSPWRSHRETEFRARRQTAVAGSIPYIEPDSPQGIHSQEVLQSLVNGVPPRQLSTVRRWADDDEDSVETTTREERSLSTVRKIL